MKKTLYLLIALLLGLTSCVQPLGPNELLPKADDKGRVAVTMELQIPDLQLYASTKALGDRSVNPSIKDIRVAVFGTSGYLQDYSLAEPVDEDGNLLSSFATTNYRTENDVYHFKVLLPVYDGEAHVHIIANGPESLPYVGEDEKSIMSNMESSGNVGAFWASVVLPDGILPEMTDDGIMMTDDKGNFLPTQTTIDRFRNLTLIRNFASVALVVNDGAGVSSVTWTLVNDPTYGAVVPYDNDFVNDFKDYIFYNKTGKMVLIEKNDQGERVPVTDDEGNITNIEKTYQGYSVSSNLNSWVEGTDILTEPGENNKLFCFERQNPTNPAPTFILMKATYTATNKVCYYRIDLKDDVLKDYFPIYRNCDYVITISQVGNEGDSTPEEAILRDSGGNMSISEETRTLTDVSDGKARLYVEYVEKTYTNSIEATKDFWVYYVPDVTVSNNGEEIVDNSYITVRVADKGTALKTGAYSNGQELTIDQNDDRNDRYGKYFYKITLNPQSETDDLESVIEVEASNPANNSTLFRKIKIKVMKKMDMELSFDPPTIPEGVDETTVLHIALADTLQESMFPLEFYIEDSNRTLNPTGKDKAGIARSVPVKTGPSIWDETNENSYYFIRTVNWSEYEPMLIRWRAADEAEASTEGIIDFTTEFKTIKENGATTVYVDNEYFNMQSKDLSLRPTFKWDVDGALSANASQRTATAVLTCTATGEWSLTTSNGVSVNPDHGTGTQTITVTIPSNMDSNGAVVRTVTAHVDGCEDQELRINQSARKSYTPNPAISTNRGVFAYEDDYVSISFRNGSGYNNNYITLENNNSGVTVTAKNSEMRITAITVSFQNNYGPTSGATWDGSSNSVVSSFSGHTYNNSTTRSYRATSITYTIEY